jgi:hypothetical protein
MDNENNALQIKKEQLDRNMYGIYSVDLGDGTFYIGEIAHGKLNGKGKLVKKDTILYDGIWIEDEKLDDIALPNELQSKPDLSTCQKLNFIIKKKTIKSKTQKTIKSKTQSKAFEFEYYIPFVNKHDLHNLNTAITKSINQTDLGNGGIYVKINNTECDLIKCVEQANNINNLAKYITNLDFVCSSCNVFNRGWSCCGQFAPFMYMYYFLLFDGNYDKYHNEFDQSNLGKPSQIYNIAAVFYKLFSSYAMYNDIYDETRNNIADLYGIDADIPNIEDNFDYWVIKYNNDNFYQTDKSQFTFKVNTPYMIMICNDEYISHYAFVYRCGNYIITCDSWASDDSDRFPITRIIKYDDFINCIITLNKLYEKIRRGKKAVDYDFILYNFIIDALFVVPYSMKEIEENNQGVIWAEDTSYISVVDPEKTSQIFDNFKKNSSHFNMYLTLGGRKANHRKDNHRKANHMKANKTLGRKKSNKRKTMKKSK